MRKECQKIEKRKRKSGRKVTGQLRGKGWESGKREGMKSRVGGKYKETQTATDPRVPAKAVCYNYATLTT